MIADKGNGYEERKNMILLVEDNPDDIEIIKLALLEGKVKARVSVVRDGVEALDFLFNRGEYADKSQAPKPSIILLDIKLPRLNGIEVLKEIKSNEKLRQIPVIMLTTSSNPKDIRDSYNYSANSYVQKPTNFKDFVELMKTIDTYWHKMNRLPEEEC